MDREHALRRIKAARAALKRRTPAGEWVPSDVIVAEMLAAADRVDRQAGAADKLDRQTDEIGLGAVFADVDGDLYVVTSIEPATVCPCDGNPLGTFPLSAVHHSWELVRDARALATWMLP